MKYLNKLLSELKEGILKNGVDYRDNRLNRNVRAVVGLGASLDRIMIEELFEEPQISKFDNDYRRMKPTLDAAIYKAMEDPTSRQLVVLNTDDFLKELQCFQLMQFIYLNGNFTCQIYQRSGDYKKYLDDLTFFSRIIKEFETAVNNKVVSMHIMYGNFHIEV